MGMRAPASRKSPVRATWKVRIVGPFEVKGGTRSGVAGAGHFRGQHQRRRSPGNLPATGQATRGSPGLGPPKILPEEVPSPGHTFHFRPIVLVRVHVVTPCRG